MHPISPPRFTGAAGFLFVLTTLFVGCAPSGSGRNGAVLFSKSFGGAAEDGVGQTVPTPDGGYLMIGSLNGRRVADATVDDDLWVSKLDALGDVEWSRLYTEEQVSTPAQLGTREFQLARPRADGGFFLVGTLDDLLDGSQVYRDVPGDITVQRLEPDGSTLWTRDYDLGGFPDYPFFLTDGRAVESPFDAAATTDGGLLVSGHAAALLRVGNQPVPLSLPFVLRLNAAGNVVWQRLIDDDAYAILQYSGAKSLVAETEDGGAVVCVSAVIERQDLIGPVSEQECRLLRLDALGNTVWSRRVTEVEGTALEVFQRQGIVPAETYVLTVLEQDVFSSDDDELRFFDAGGNQIDSQGLSGYARPWGMCYMEPGGGSRPFQYFVSGRVSGPDPGIWHDDQMRVQLFDGNFSLIAEDDLDEPTLLAQRVFDEGSGSGLDLLLARTTDAGARQAEVVAYRFDADGARTRRVEYPLRPVMAFQSPIGAQAGRFQAGWIPGSTDTWTWTPVAPEDPSLGYTLARHALTVSNLWSRTFSPAGARLTESGMYARVDVDPQQSLEWEIVVFGEVYEDTGPVTWYLRLDRFGQILTHRTYPIAVRGRWGGSFNEDPQLISDAFAPAPQGGTYFGAYLGDRPRVVRLDADGDVRWTSPPVGIDRPVAALAACEDGSVVAAGDGFLTRLDTNGDVVWRKSTQLEWTDVAVLSDGAILAVTSLFDPIGLCVEDDGSLRWSRTFLQLGGTGTSATAVTLYSTEPVRAVATEDGGAVLAFGLAGDGPLLSEVASPAENVALLRLDGEGLPSWLQVYGGLEQESVGGLARAPDGGLVLSGRSRSLGDANEGWVLRTDSAGQISSSCAAEILRIEDLLSLDVTMPYGDLLPDYPAAEDVGLPLSSGLGFAQGYVATDLVVARQCSGRSRDVAPDEASLTLRVEIEGGSGVVVEDDLGGGVPRISCPGTCVLMGAPGSVVRLTALPDPGFGTPTWTGGDCGPVTATSCSVTLDADRTVSVSFPVDNGGGGPTELYDLTIVFEGGGSGSVQISPLNGTCGATCSFEDLASSGESFQLFAMPSSGSSFGGWSDCDLVDGTFCSITFGASDRTVRVRFD